MVLYFIRDENMMFLNVAGVEALHCMPHRMRKVRSSLLDSGVGRDNQTTPRVSWTVSHRDNRH